MPHTHISGTWGLALVMSHVSLVCYGRKERVVVTQQKANGAGLE